MSDTYEVKLRLVVVNEDLFDRAVKLTNSDAYQEASEDVARDEQIERIVTDLDVIALAYGHAVGWHDVGLERVD